MFPIHLNLLSPEKRKLIERLVYTQFLRNAIEIGVFLLAICGTVLVASDRVLQDHLNSLTENLVAISNREAEKNKRLKDINEILYQTDLLQSKYSLWSETIPVIMTVIPAGVTLTNLTLDPEAKQWTFAGVAKTRDDLLLMQKNLESLPRIASAVIPISQLTGKDNISFSFTAELK